MLVGAHLSACLSAIGNLLAAVQLNLYVFALSYNVKLPSPYASRKLMTLRIFHTSLRGLFCLRFPKFAMNLSIFLGASSHDRVYIYIMHYRVCVCVYCIEKRILC